MTSFAVKKAHENAESLTRELSAEEMAAAKGAGGSSPTIVAICEDVCVWDEATGTGSCQTVCHYEVMDEII